MLVQFPHSGLIYRPGSIYNEPRRALLWGLLLRLLSLWKWHLSISFQSPSQRSPSTPGLIVPRMARTVLSFSTSMEPEQTKKMAWRASPCRRRYSPGAQKEVLMCSDNERKQPRLAEANSDSSRISLLRCMVISDRSSSGKSFSSWGDNGREETWGEEAGKREEEPWQVWKHDHAVNTSVTPTSGELYNQKNTQKQRSKHTINALFCMEG